MENKDTTTKEKEPAKKVGVPTMKTFVFGPLKSSLQIDREMNSWLRSQTLAGLSPLLVKAETKASLFGSTQLYVFMFQTPTEIKKN